MKESFPLNFLWLSLLLIQEQIENRHHVQKVSHPEKALLYFLQYCCVRELLFLLELHIDVRQNRQIGRDYLWLRIEHFSVF